MGFEKLKNRIKQTPLIYIYRFIKKLILTFFWGGKLILVPKKSDYKYVECFVFFDFLGRVKKNNWGDDLNKYLFECLTDETLFFIPYEETFLSCKTVKYSLIGSIIGNYNLDKTIVYGSGAIRSNVEIKGKPQKIISVRGPLTRKVFLENGVQCPENYGDPVLVLPKFYNPQIEKTNKVGVVPNIGTVNNSVVDRLIKNENYFLIDTSQYDDWRDIVDKILSCSYVISESLHGLIVAEAYNIPSVWVEFKEHPPYWDFKYNDFYLSIGKYGQVSLKLYVDELENIEEKIKEWKPGCIDIESIVDDFPFVLKNSINIEGK